jgi:hypothetical protein
MTRNTSIRWFHLVSMLGFALATANCREASIFLPSDPDTIRERTLAALNAHPNLQMRAIAAGATVEVAPWIENTPCETGSVTRFMMDWTSNANHLTITLYQTVPGEALNSSGFFNPTCRVPGSFNAAPSLPVCPVVASVTTGEKPKVLQLSLERGMYSIAVTNTGPGNETIRSVLEDIGRHTRVC